MGRGTQGRGRGVGRGAWGRGAGCGAWDAGPGRGLWGAGRGMWGAGREAPGRAAQPPGCSGSGLHKAVSPPGSRPRGWRCGSARDAVSSAGKRPGHTPSPPRALSRCRVIPAAARARPPLPGVILPQRLFVLPQSVFATILNAGKQTSGRVHLWLEIELSSSEPFWRAAGYLPASPRRAGVGPLAARWPGAQWQQGTLLRLRSILFVWFESGLRSRRLLYPFLPSFLLVCAWWCAPWELILPLLF